MKKLLVGCLVVVVLAAACGVAAATVGKDYLESRLATDLPDECPEIAVSQDAAVSFLTKVLTAGEGATQTRSVRVTVTQQELTSFVAIGSLLAEQMQELQNLQNLQNLSPEQAQQLQELENLQGMERLQALQEFNEQRQESGNTGPTGLPIPDTSLHVALEEPQICFRDDGRVAVEGYGAIRGRRQPLRLILAPRASQGELVLDFVEGDLGPVPMPEPVFDTIGSGLSKAILAGRDYAEIDEISVQQGSITIGGRLK